MSAETDRWLAELFDRFVDDALDGRDTHLAPLLGEHGELHQEIESTHRLARGVAGRRRTPLPRIAGFDVLRLVGRGGMGLVYLARQTDLDRPVALKVLPQAAQLDERARQRFLHEARALARLRDELVVRVHQVIDSGELLAFAMEWIEGPSLRQVLDRLRGLGRPASLADLAAILGTQVPALGGRDLGDWLVRTGVCIARALAVQQPIRLGLEDVARHSERLGSDLRRENDAALREDAELFLDGHA